MRHWHWFQFVSGGILALFLGLLLVVIAIAYARHSGSTGLDIAAIQKMRFDSLPKQTTDIQP